MIGASPVKPTARMFAAHDARPVYTIDADDRIVHVNEAWLLFNAGASDADVLRDYVGLPVWELLGEGRVRQLWQVLYRRVRAIGASIFVPMRVDTADERRLLDIEVRPLADRSIQHVCECAWTEARAPVALLDPVSQRDEREVLCCAWCRRVQIGVGVWQEIEDAERSLGIRPAGTLPRLRPDVCVTCQQALLQTFPARVA
jgi:hypothetical protein